MPNNFEQYLHNLKKLLNIVQQLDLFRLQIREISVRRHTFFFLKSQSRSPWAVRLQQA